MINLNLSRIKIKGWLKAAALATGLLIQTTTGFAKVKNNITLDSIATVYNFTVEKNHTYFVGKQQLLVHNDCKKLAKILGDLGTKSDELVTFLKTVPVARHPKILEAVEMLQSAIRTNSQFAVDPATLNKLADIMTNGSTFRTKLGASWKEVLEALTSPKVHKKRNDNPILNQYISLPALGYAKLAWRQGIEVEVKSNLVPKELLPIKPLNNYEIPYDFLK